jgi:hypothetical protein
MLVCPECRHENEAARIYCHDCGTRLNRSGLAREKSEQERPEETQRRIKQMFGSQGAVLRHNVRRIIKFVVGSAAAAAIIVTLMPPQVPEKKKSDTLPRQINFDLDTAITNHHGAQRQYTEEQVNAYLVNALRNKQAALDHPLLRFERALVMMDEGICRITAERSLFGYSLYTTGIFAVSAGDGKLVSSCRGGSIGRLQIHPAVMKYGTIIFGDLWKALEREQKLVAKLAAIDFHPQAVVLTAPTQ